MLEISAPDFGSNRILRADISVGRLTGLTVNHQIFEKKRHANLYVEIAVASRCFETSTKTKVNLSDVDSGKSYGITNFLLGGPEGQRLCDNVDFDETFSVEYVDEPLCFEVLVRTHELNDRNILLGYGKFSHETDTTEERRTVVLLNSIYLR